jgi:hypothetical protein
MNQERAPNVTYVYSTSLCVGPAYYAVCAKGGYDERPWPPEIYESYWDEEEEEFVIMYSGESPCEESDAPTRYEYHTESDYSTGLGGLDGLDGLDGTRSSDAGRQVLPKRRSRHESCVVSRSTNDRSFRPPKIQDSSFAEYRVFVFLDRLSFSIGPARTG